VIATVDELVAAHEWLRRRHRLKSAPSRVVLESVRAEAVQLAATTADEPAAIWFALGRRGRALSDVWALLPDLVALNALQASGRALDANAKGALRALRTRVVTRTASYEDVRAWFSANTR